MTAPGRYVWVALGAASIAFHLGLIFSGLVPNLLSRPLHMLLALPWIFLFAAKSRGETISGAILTLLGASLGRLGQSDQACLTLAEVAARFPMSDAVPIARNEMASLGCQ